MILIPHYCQHPYYWNPALHLLYVEDERRMDAFERAIREIVRPGMRVADIGTGTGVLSRMAVEAGASVVYAVERERAILPLTRRVNAELAVGGVVRLVEGDAREVELDEQVDVVVAELIGGLGNDEGMSDVLESVRQRHLKPRGVMIPKRVLVYLAPVSAPEAWSTIPDVYQGDVIVPPEQARPSFQAYYQILGLPPERLLSAAQVLDDIDLLAHTELDYSRTFNFHLDRAGILSGFVAWFTAHLTDSVRLDTSPWAPSTCWGQAFFPIQRQIEVALGDVVEIGVSASVEISVDQPVYDWKVSLCRGEKRLATFCETNRLTKPES
jgi:SAM-dependent methyltransferase